MITSIAPAPDIFSDPFPRKPLRALVPRQVTTLKAEPGFLQTGQVAVPFAVVCYSGQVLFALTSFADSRYPTNVYNFYPAPHLTLKVLYHHPRSAVNDKTFNPTNKKLDLFHLILDNPIFTFIAEYLGAVNLRPKIQARSLNIKNFSEINYYLKAYLELMYA